MGILLLYSLVDEEKNKLGLPAISMTMQMHRCNLESIAQ
jgi:hypothetical protein